jgi:2-keto-3-deoxy-L-fuconate dehydrogenase
MTSFDFSGKRVLITQADTFMGRALCETFAECGAELIADRRPLVDVDLPAQLIQQAGRVDVLVANLACAHHAGHRRQ